MNYYLRNKHIIYNIILLIVILVTIIPTIIYASKSIPAPDDFTNAHANFEEAKHGNINSYFVPAIRKTMYIYKNGGVIISRHLQISFCHLC